jgi:hypothetical protein
LQLFFLLEKIFLYVQTVIWYLSPTKYSVMLIVTCNCLFILYLCENLFFINLVPNVIDILIYLIFFLFHNASIWPLPKNRKKRNKKGKKKKSIWVEPFFSFRLSKNSFWVNLTLKLLWQITRNTLMHLLLKDPRSKDASQRYYFYSRPYTNCYNFTLSSASPSYTFVFSWY